MSESFSIEAILSAKDEMSSTFSKVLKNVDSFSSKCGSVAKNVMIGQLGAKAVSTVTGALASNLSNAIDRFDTLQSYPKVMQSLGFSTEQSQASVAKLNESIQGLPTGLDDVVTTAKSLASVTGNIDTATDTTIALNHAFLASGASTEDASRGLQQYSQMLAKGTVDLESWRTLQETMAPALSKVAKHLGIASGDANELYDALKAGTISFDEFNQAMIECDTETGGFAETAQEASKGIKTSMTNIKSAVANLEQGFIGAFNNMLKSKNFGGIVDNLEKVKSKIYDLRNAIMHTNDNGMTWEFNPEALQVATEAFEFLQNVIEKTVSSVGKFFKAFAETGVIQTAVQTINDVKDAITNVVDSLEGSGVFESLGNTFGQIAEQVLICADNIAKFVAKLDPSTIKIMAKAVKDLALAFVAFKIGKSVYSQFKQLKSSAQDTYKSIKSVYDKLKDLKANGVGKNKDKDNTADDEKKGVFEELSDANKIDDSSIKEIEAKTKQLETKMEGVAKNIKSVFDGIAKNIKTVFDGLAKNIKTIFDGIAKVIKSAFDGIAKVVTSAGKAIATSAKGIGTGLATAFKGLGTGIATASKGIGTGLATAFRGIGEAIAMMPPTTLLALGVAFVAFGTGLAIAGSQGEGLKTILEGVATCIQAFAPIVQTVVDGIVQCFQTLPAVLQSVNGIIQTIFQGWVSVITATGTQINNILHTCFDGISDIISTALEGASGIIDSVFGGIADTISSVCDGISENIDSCFNGMSEVITSACDGVQGILEGIADVIDSIGQSALNAGKGFDLLADGVVKITSTNLADMASSLGTVAVNVGKIATNSSGLADAGNGMSKLTNNITKLGASAPQASSALQSIQSSCSQLGSSLGTLPQQMSQLKTSMTGFAETGTSMSTSMVALGTAITDFNAQLVLMSTAMTTMNTSFTTLSTTMSTMVTAVTLLVTSFTLLTTQLTTMGTQLVAMSTNFMKLQTNTTTLSQSLLKVGTNGATAISGLLQINSIAQQCGSSLGNLASVASSAMSGFASAISSGASQGRSAMSNACSQIVSQAQNGLNRLPSVASSAMSKFASALSSGGSQAVSVMNSIMSSIYSAMSNGYGRAYQAGAYIGQGLANGLASACGQVQAQAQRLAEMADVAIRKKAEIGSPSKVQYQNGVWFGEGLANGMSATGNLVKKTAEQMMYIPNMVMTDLSNGFDFAMNGNYSYALDTEYSIEVPLNIDGREFARTTVKYTQEELNRANAFKQKLKGV